MHPEDTIILSDLTTGYRGTAVTTGINASLRAGALTCLLGPNGAGKSTLLKTLSGFLPPLGGIISYRGTELCDLGLKQLARLVGVVLTERPAITNMTVAELVALGRSPYTSFLGGVRDTDRRIVDEAMAMVGITALSHRNAATLSDGERQKTFIAKALAQQTPVIFLDEPTAFLDYPSKVEIMRLLRELAYGRGKTVFMSTHDLELALQLADTLWLLDREHGLRIGTPEDLAVDGSLALYFQNASLRFDAQTCAFAVELPQAGRVRLAGEGRMLAPVRKALARKGYVVDNGADAPEVRVSGDTVSVAGKDARTIGEALEMLNALKLP